ncbi:Uncharacterized protein APZ42_016964, partial [Daphnia magna]
DHSISNDIFSAFHIGYFTLGIFSGTISSLSFPFITLLSLPSHFFFHSHLCVPTYVVCYTETTWYSRSSEILAFLLTHETHGWECRRAMCLIAIKIQFWAPVCSLSPYNALTVYYHRRRRQCRRNNTLCEFSVYLQRSCFVLRLYYDLFVNISLYTTIPHQSYDSSACSPQLDLEWPNME